MLIPPALREGLWFIVPLSLLWAALMAAQNVYALAASIVVLLAIVACIGFFRDPERRIPPEPQLILSAADGLVTDVEKLEEGPFDLGPCWRVSVFLSVFDVHVNRAPVAGEVLRSEHRPGQFLDVRHPDAAARNERQTWLLRTPDGQEIAVRQIAGLVARRIVPWAKVGDSLERGERFGMIRFGSRTDVFLPLDCEITVRVGDRVHGASSAVAIWPALENLEAPEEVLLETVS
ncbi:MAG: phosphatidylserine decarboxylase family protein [Verrucomicrobiota bacterium]